MSEPTVQAAKKPNTSLLLRGAIWIAIGALIAAALVCVVWVLVSDQQNLVGRAFLTILLLAAFGGIAILEASLAPQRPDWLALVSMISWIVALLVGAAKIWLPADAMNGFGMRGVNGAERLFQFLLAVLVLQLAVVHVRIFWRAVQRHVTTFTRIVAYTTFAFLAMLVALLVFFLTFPHVFHYSELYWRIVVALTILTAVGSTLIPLLNALFAPRRPTAALPAAPAWPTYADRVTPLPMLHDGSPDWNAYYTGVPTVEASAVPVASLPAVPVPPAAPASPSAPTTPVAPLPPTFGGPGTAPGSEAAPDTTDVPADPPAAGPDTGGFPAAPPAAPNRPQS